MIRRPPRSTQSRSSAASDVYKRQALVKAVLDRLGVARTVVVGHSMGGEVATAFAAANPANVERLVLIDTPPKLETAFDLKTRLGLMPLIGQGLWRVRTDAVPVSYTHLRAHETDSYLVCRLL